MIRSGSLLWFARHEGRLAWREWISLMTGGRRRRRIGVILGMGTFVVFVHVLAWVVVGGRVPAITDKDTLVLVTGSGLLLLPVMVSQAMETVTRAFYARADLDLIISSPVAAARLFAVRIAAMALSVTMTATLLASPLINVLAVRGGWRWLAAYGGVAAVGMLATAMAVGIVVALFRTIGPRRTRLAAQIVASIIGAAFVIGIQIVAIMSYGTMSRTNVLLSDTVMSHAPSLNNALWWPARGALGDSLIAFIGLLGFGLAALLVAIVLFAPGFARSATIAAGVSHDAVARQRREVAFRTRSPAGTLRRKEWALLLRDPWLVSQSLMQLLYLVVPAVLLWRSVGSGMDVHALLVPVLIMTSGQLAGGLTWVAISGEDAPDLIASAPVTSRRVVRAKLEAVMGAAGIVFAPFIAVFALVSPPNALITAGGVTLATACAATIQLWFRAQAKRSNFRRRQTSSRVATFAEAFSTITWAAAGAMAANGGWFAAIVLGIIILGVLAGIRLIRPARTATV